VIADRLARVLLLRVGNLVIAGTQGVVALLVLTDQAELWMLIALEAMNGAAVALSLPALAGVMPQLVPRELLQQANVLQSMSRGALRIIGPTIGALLVVTVGPGWAVAVDALTWVVASLLLLPVKLPKRKRAEDAPSTLTELREGWSLFVGTTWLWVIVLAFGVLNAMHMGAWFTLGPPLAKDTIGERGWGLVLSAESLGLLAMAAFMLRRRLERPLLVGMLGVSVFGVALIMLGAETMLLPLLVAAFVAGAGMELFGLGWNLAMQENIEERMLSRAYSYDMLGSYVAIPVGQLLSGPLSDWLGLRPVLVASGIIYAGVCLLTLASPAVRNLERQPRAESETLTARS